ncbi:unnamed protein product [Adineta steineri]|uniref:Uncharacterized protein n=1 Tax=Adineta steineri TaxID=433720 RepID=A0A813W0U5_9BILA|nr:unnamed protein product [Adineta steineri]CAF3853408.1 unnamed protein product [Adineta steineri]
MATSMKLLCLFSLVIIMVNLSEGRQWSNELDNENGDDEQGYDLREVLESVSDKRGCLPVGASVDPEECDKCCKPSCGTKKAILGTKKRSEQWVCM